MKPSTRRLLQQWTRLICILVASWPLTHCKTATSSVNANGSTTMYTNDPNAKVRKFPLTTTPSVGTTRDGDVIPLGGFSGLSFLGKDPKTGNLRFVTHTDRGPNTEPTVIDGLGETRGFPLPAFQPRLVMLELDVGAGKLTVTGDVKLRRPDGRPLTGLPNRDGDEVAVDLRGNRLPLDPFGADLEGVAIAAGSYWLGDEYRPSIFRFDMTGGFQQRYVPIGAAGDGTSLGTEVLPAVLATRKLNRGFETIAAEGDLVYAIVQSPIEPTGPHSGPAHNCRMIVLDAKTGRLVGHYIYTMESNGLSDKLGDMTAIGGGRFLVLERDDDPTTSAQKRIFVVDLKGATNLVGKPAATWDERSGIDSLPPDVLRSRGIVPLGKRLLVDLPAIGMTGFEKLEGLAVVDAHTLAIVNDNDFGLQGDFDPKTGRLAPNPRAETPTLTLVHVEGGWRD